MTAKRESYASVDRAFREGRSADAELLLRKLLQVDPADIRAGLLLGVALARRGELQESISVFERNLALDPRSVESLNWLSILWRRVGRLGLAERSSLEATRLEPGNADGFNNLGLVYIAQGRMEDASRALEQAVKLRPSDAQVHHNMGVALEGLGRDDQAMSCYREAVALSERALPSHLALGRLMLKRGNAIGAYDTAQRLLRVDPKAVSARLLAARALTNLGRAAEAETETREAIRLDPNQGAGFGMLGFQLQSSGRFAEAASAFRRSLELNPHQGSSYWGLRQGAKATSEDAPELDRLSRLAELTTAPEAERSYFFYALGKGWSELGDYDRAIRSYDRANELAFQAQLAGKSFDSASYGAAYRATIELFTQSFIERYSGIANDSVKPIFIVGMMRSGTTLLEQILSSHPEVEAGGELQFWLQHGPKVVDPGRRLIDPVRSRQMANEYLSLLNRISPDKRVTDKTPENIQFLGLIKAIFPKAKIINMNRHPVDNCLSIYFTPYECPPPFAYVRENIAFAYKREQELAEHWRREVPPGSFLDVHYEKLVEDREAVIRSALEYCELDWDDSCLSHTENRRTVNTPSVWQVRQPIYKSSVALWKSYEPNLGPFAELMPKESLHE